MFDSSPSVRPTHSLVGGRPTDESVEINLLSLRSHPFPPWRSPVRKSYFVRDAKIITNHCGDHRGYTNRKIRCPANPKNNKKKATAEDIVSEKRQRRLEACDVRRKLKEIEKKNLKRFFRYSCIQLPLFEEITGAPHVNSLLRKAFVDVPIHLACRRRLTESEQRSESRTLSFYHTFSSLSLFLSHLCAARSVLEFVWYELFEVYGKSSAYPWFALRASIGLSSLLLSFFFPN